MGFLSGTRTSDGGLSRRMGAVKGGDWGIGRRAQSTLNKKALCAHAKAASTTGERPVARPCARAVRLFSRRTLQRPPLQPTDAYAEDHG
jgi:hypothetical protein